MTIAWAETRLPYNEDRLAVAASSGEGLGLGARREGSRECTHRVRQTWSWLGFSLRSPVTLSQPLNSLGLFLHLQNRTDNAWESPFRCLAHSRHITWDLAAALGLGLGTHSTTRAGTEQPRDSIEGADRWYELILRRKQDAGQRPDYGPSIRGTALAMYGLVLPSSHGLSLGTCWIPWRCIPPLACRALPISLPQLNRECP